MNTATINELKKELQRLSSAQLVEVCLRITKYKKENKELLTYVLLDSDNESGYIQTIKDEIAVQFEELNTSNLYVAKKGLQKLVRNISKYIKYSGLKQTEIEVLLCFCWALKRSDIKIHQNTVITNLYQRQLKKIEKAIAGLHEDLQYDYQQELDQLY